MLLAYCDESGNHDDAKVFAIAGYIGHAKEWKALEVEWLRVLQMESVSVFHAAECENGLGEFKGRSRENRDAIFRRLIQTINQRALHAVGVGMPMDSYRSLLPELRTLRKSPKYTKSPYFLAFDWAIQELCHATAHFPHRQRVSFVFDRQKEFQGRAKELYQLLLDSPPTTVSYHDRLGSIEFKDKMATVQLQAADLLAYESYRYAVDHKLGGKKVRWQLQLIKERPLNGKWLDERGLRLLIDACNVRCDD